MARKKTTENNDIRPIKRRSRSGCHNCTYNQNKFERKIAQMTNTSGAGKRLKVKCDETKPVCLHCSKNGTACDYSLKLLWGGRPYKTPRVEKTTSYTTIVTTRTVPASADLATQLGYRPLQNTNNDCQGPQNVIFQESPLSTLRCQRVPLKKALRPRDPPPRRAYPRHQCCLQVQPSRPPQYCFPARPRPRAISPKILPALIATSLRARPAWPLCMLITTTGTRHLFRRRCATLPQLRAALPVTEV